jgi:hypothetical protein
MWLIIPFPGPTFRCRHDRARTDRRPARRRRTARPRLEALEGRALLTVQDKYHFFPPVACNWGRVLALRVVGPSNEAGRPLSTLIPERRPVMWFPSRQRHRNVSPARERVLAPRSPRRVGSALAS